MNPHRPVTDDLSVEGLLRAYAAGYFPMVHSDGEIYWHNPANRAVFNLDDIKPDRVTARLLRSGRWRFTCDAAFEQVIRSCADRQETWIDGRIIHFYCALHQSGYAHSVEAWSGDELVGGIYGVSLGRAFFGESMFGRDNAGKAVFHVLVEQLRKQAFTLFDTQYVNPFTERLGAVEIPRAEYKRRLRLALDPNTVIA